MKIYPTSPPTYGCSRPNCDARLGPWTLAAPCELPSGGSITPKFQWWIEYHGWSFERKDGNIWLFCPRHSRVAAPQTEQIPDYETVVREAERDSPSSEPPTPPAAEEPTKPSLADGCKWHRCVYRKCEERIASYSTGTSQSELELAFAAAAAQAGWTVLSADPPMAVCRSHKKEGSQLLADMGRAPYAPQKPSPPPSPLDIVRHYDRLRRRTFGEEGEPGFAARILLKVLRDEFPRSMQWEAVSNLASRVMDLEGEQGRHGRDISLDSHQALHAIWKLIKEKT